MAPPVAPNLASAEQSDSTAAKPSRRAVMTIGNYLSKYSRGKKRALTFARDVPDYPLFLVHYDSANTEQIKKMTLSENTRSILRKHYFKILDTWTELDWIDFDHIERATAQISSIGAGIVPVATWLEDWIKTRQPSDAVNQIAQSASSILKYQTPSGQA
jgi:hypothetical protein